VLRDVRPELPRQLGPVARGVKTKHLAAIRLQQLYCEQAEKAEPQHDDALAQRGLCLPHALQSNRAKRHEACFLIVNAIRHSNAQVLGDDIVLGVIRPTRTGAGHPFSTGHLDVLPHVEHMAGAAVTERDRCIEFGPDLLERRNQPLATGLCYDLTHEIRARHSLSGEVRAGKVHQHLFCAGADQ
jgi:hypothetical protein